MSLLVAVQMLVQELENIFQNYLLAIILRFVISYFLFAIDQLLLQIFLFLVKLFICLFKHSHFFISRY